MNGGGCLFDVGDEYEAARVQEGKESGMREEDALGELGC